MEPDFHPSADCSAGGLPESDERFDDDAPDVPPCPHCNGTGGDPLDDYCTSCEHCNGEGTQWWLP